MITDLILEMFFGVIRWLVSFLPAVQLPPWVANISTMGGEVFGIASSMGVWFPWSTILTVLSAVFAAAVAGFGIKVVRMVISHVSGGGGSAA